MFGTTRNSNIFWNRVIIPPWKVYCSKYVLKYQDSCWHELMGVISLCKGEWLSREIISAGVLTSDQSIAIRHAIALENTTPYTSSESDFSFRFVVYFPPGINCTFVKLTPQQIPNINDNRHADIFSQINWTNGPFSFCQYHCFCKSRNLSKYTNDNAGLYHNLDPAEKTSI